MSDKEYTLEEKLEILYRQAWLNGLDGEKHMEKWKLKVKEMLELK
jgi:hypothetical protein